jgi:hypothetical protein
MDKGQVTPFSNTASLSNLRIEDHTKKLEYVTEGDAEFCGGYMRPIAEKVIAQTDEPLSVISFHTKMVYFKTTTVFDISEVELVDTVYFNLTTLIENESNTKVRVLLPYSLPLSTRFINLSRIKCNVPLKYSELANLDCLHIQDTECHKNSISFIISKMEKLRQLHVSEENNVRQWPWLLDANVFKKCLLLETLTMQNNNITNMPTLKHLVRIKKIDFSGNQITKLNMTAFPSCSEYISLADNPISKIYKSEDTSMVSLRTMCLRNTNICEVRQITCIVDIVHPSCTIDTSGCKHLPCQDLSLEFDAKYFPFILSSCQNKRPKEETMTCAICLTKPKSIVFMPCRHMCACEACAKKVSHCPICRKSIVNKVAVFVC